MQTTQYHASGSHFRLATHFARAKLSFFRFLPTPLVLFTTTTQPACGEGFPPVNKLDKLALSGNNNSWRGVLPPPPTRPIQLCKSRDPGKRRFQTRKPRPCLTLGKSGKTFNRSFGEQWAGAGLKMHVRGKWPEAQPSLLNILYRWGIHTSSRFHFFFVSRKVSWSLVSNKAFSKSDFCA